MIILLRKIGKYSCNAGQYMPVIFAYRTDQAQCRIIIIRMVVFNEGIIFIYFAEKAKINLRQVLLVTLRHIVGWTLKGGSELCHSIRLES